MLRSADDKVAAARAHVGAPRIPRQSGPRERPPKNAALEVRRRPDRRRDVAVEALLAALAGLTVPVVDARLEPMAGIAVVLWCLVTYRHHPTLVGPLSRQLSPLAVNAAVMIALAGVTSAVGVLPVGSQAPIVLSVSAAAVVAALVRVCRVRGAGPIRAVVVGDNMEIARRVDGWHDRADVLVVGAVLVGPEPDGAMLLRTVPGVPLCASLDELPARVQQWQADLVSFAPGAGLSQAAVRRSARALQHSHASVTVTGQLEGIAPQRIRLGVVGGETVCEVSTLSYPGAKRLMDLAVSLAVLTLLMPLLVTVALLVKLDGGPVFFTQVRVGLNGKPFRIIKFRSMHQDAESYGTWTTALDRRVTGVGHFLRCTSLDELPQLINVLRGDMSIVGPRPEQPRYVTSFAAVIPDYLDRHRAKAGITGWAQVNGFRGDTSIAERTRYDLWYAENSSLLLDLRIMLRTAATLLFAKNAY